MEANTQVSQSLMCVSRALLTDAWVAKQPSKQTRRNHWLLTEGWLREAAVIAGDTNPIGGKSALNWLQKYLCVEVSFCEITPNGKDYCSFYWV